MDGIGDRGIGNITSWLSGLGRRREAIAQNIANIDTPNYQRKRVDFESELRQSTQKRSEVLGVTHKSHIPISPSGTGLRGPEGSQELVSSRRDGNNVDIDQEMVELAETQMRYNAATNALSTKLQTLRDVLRSI